MEMTIVASHEGLGSGTHLDRPTYGATFQGGFFDSRDTFQGWLAIKTLISGDITKIPEKSSRNTSSCFPWGFSSSSFYTLSGPEKMKLFKTFHLFMFFSKKKMKIYVISSQGPSGFSSEISHTPGGFRLYSLDADGRISPWKHRGLVVPKVWWLSTVGYPKPKPTLPKTITYHHISQPWKLGEQSSTQRWDTRDILSIPLSHPNYQLRINYWYPHFLTYRVTIVFGTWDICLAYSPRDFQIIPSILEFPSLMFTRGIQPCC